jgi:hypothetical protein
MSVQLIHSVLVSDLPKWEARGWRDTGTRDHRPSVSEPIAIIERPAEQLEAWIERQLAELDDSYSDLWARRARLAKLQRMMRGL